LESKKLSIDPSLGATKAFSSPRCCEVHLGTGWKVTMSAKGSIDGVVADFKGDIIQVNDLQ
jgi:hypothetical protein